MIVPVLKRADPAPRDDALDLRPDLRPLADNLAGELLIMYAFDLPGHFEYLSCRDCQSLGIDHASLRSLSVRNLTRRRTKPEILRPSGAAFMLRLDGDLEASLLLADHLWPQLQRRVGGEIVVAVPSRDVLAISGTGITGGVQALRRAVARAWQHPVNPKLALTRSPLVRRGQSWHVFDPP